MQMVGPPAQRGHGETVQTSTQWMKRERLLGELPRKSHTTLRCLLAARGKRPSLEQLCIYELAIFLFNQSLG